MVSAFEKALSEHTDTALKASTEAPDWFVLEVCFPEECIAKAFPPKLAALEFQHTAARVAWSLVAAQRECSWCVLAPSRLMRLRGTGVVRSELLMRAVSSV